MKRKAKSLPKLKADLQKIFNEFIRLRDKDQPCISCGQFKTLQAGHYYSVKGYDGLRFNEDNVHGECASCNCWDESHLIHYGLNLPDRIGVERNRDLFINAANYKHDGYKWCRYELAEMIELYKKKVAELKN